MISSQEGNFLIKLARNAIATYLNEKKVIDIPIDTPDSLMEKRGAFVTINESGNLRGCIGYSEPIKPLVNTVIEVAISAATSDPRFYPLKKTELEKITLEVSVLSKPHLIQVTEPQEYLEKVKVSEDGLIVEKGFNKGLLLPQVASEWGWDSEELLCHTCMKAGLSPDCWLDSDTKVYNFQAQVFQEKE
ncbi:MAG: TIGR00296 family protein [Euryarchaeota archaeon]